jgi:site-specific DNA-methyltransferase (adenine-specific)
MSSLKSTDTQKTDTDYSAQTATSQWVCMDIVRTLKVSFEGKEYDFIELLDGSLVWNENLEPYRKQQKLNVAENVLKYGTGGINIDESRVGAEEIDTSKNRRDTKTTKDLTWVMGKDGGGEIKIGRFPANLIHDNSEEVRECFPETKDTHKNEVRKFVSKKRGDGFLDALTQEGEHITRKSITDSGNASRFFKSIIYQAKASKSERNKGCEGLNENETLYNQTGLKNNGDGTERPTGGMKNNHPTVKPVQLMEYLIKMVTPKGGIVLDPFAGSGSTLVAAKENGYQYIGIEMTAEYIPIIEARLNYNSNTLF